MKWMKVTPWILMIMVGTLKAEVVYTNKEVDIQLTLISLNFSRPWFDDTFSPKQRVELFDAAEECIDLYLKTPFPTGESKLCSFTFDGWKCWNYTQSGETVKQKCPAYVPLSNEDRYAYKVCNDDGKWYVDQSTGIAWTNYTKCLHAPSEPPHIVYYVGYSLSVICCSTALFIFCYFKSLGCPRVTMHKNLFLSFILHGVTFIIYTATIPGNHSVLERDGFDCKLLLMLWQYFQMCSYFWMLCEGIYLHLVVVVAALSTQSSEWWYYLIGWALPMVFIVVSVICKTLLTDKIAGDSDACWISSSSSLDWIIAGPMILVLIVNLFLLSNILRVLLSKLRHTYTSTNSSYRRAARATLILVPLLGLHYIIIPINIKSDEFYKYFMAVCLSFQGFFVACIFCFFNGEVKAQVSRRWRNYTVNRRSRRRYTHHSIPMNTSMTEVTSSSTPQNTRRNKDLMPDHQANGSMDTSQHLGNGNITDANSNTKFEKQSEEVDTPLIDVNLDRRYSDTKKDTAV